MATQIILLLDKSGSMYERIDDTIGGLNSFVDDIKIRYPDSVFSLYHFSDKCQEIFTKKPITDVEPFTKEDYSPSGNTALYDSMGLILSTYKTGKFVIMTDGCENASTKFSKTSIKNMISASSLDVTYIGADVSEATEDFGIERSVEYVGIRTPEMFRFASQNI